MLNCFLLMAHNVEEHIPKVELSHQAEVSTYAVARFFMDISTWLLSLFGLDSNAELFTFVYACMVFAVAFAIGYIFQAIILVIAKSVGKHINSDIYQLLLKDRFFTKACRIVPAIVFLILLQFTMGGKQTLLSLLTRVTWIYIIFIVAKSLTIVSSVAWKHIDARENSRRLPLKGLVQLVKGIIWIVAIIIIVAILVNKSPGALLAGLGAFAAVLMLIFKDSILGLVAGVQLSENDSLHVGDWIKVNGTDANGVVTEVSLTCVKVLNWDKTTTSLPPYSLISGAFTNYRSMQLSNTRRIQRVYMIDADSIVPTTDEMLDSFSSIPFLKEWIEKKKAQRDAGKVEDVANSEGLVDGSIETNLGVFRAYFKMYLDAHTRIEHSGGDNVCFVTTLTQSSTGVPLQIYCFTNTSAWLDYEAIQASIFEHLAAMLSRFNLVAFEYPSGRDTVLEGYLSPGKNPSDVFGMPYPFFNNELTNAPVTQPAKS